MENKTKENREEFYLKYFDLFQDGTLREVHTGNNLSIYAVAEQAYAVITFTDKLTDDVYMYFGLNELEIKELLEDESFFERIFADRKKQNRIPLITSETKKNLQVINANRLSKGEWLINEEMESKLFPKTIEKTK